MLLVDLVGRRFGKLTVLHRNADHIAPSGQHIRMWQCRCDCGNERNVAGQNLIKGHTQSCGCLRSHNRLKHGECFGGKPTRLYRIWAGMKSRCSSPGSSHYEKYGARGISVCADWDDFTKFKEWAIESGYNDSLTLDRIDVNGNYSPENCRWVSYKTQGNNTRRNMTFEFNHQIHTLSEWAEITHIPYKALWERINRGGWSIEKALTTPISEVKSRNGGVRNQ